MTITAEVRGCTVTLRQPPLASGTRGDVTVAFRFDTAWDGYARTAVFRAHGKTVLVLLENDCCALPPEAAAGGDVLLGVFGVRGDATLTTPFARLAVAAGVPTAGDAAAAVTPTLAAQLLAAYRRLTAATAEAKAGDTAAVRVTAGTDSLHFAFTLPKGDKGDKGDTGDKGDKGEDGYTPVRGTDYWTDADKAAIHADIAAQVADKVDKVDGKGLSSNDYTDADEAAVAGLRTNLTHIGDIEITESGTTIAVKDNLSLRTAVVLLTVPDGMNAFNTEFKFDDGSAVTRWCSNLNAGRITVEVTNGIPWLDYSFIKGADTATQTPLSIPNSVFRAAAAGTAKKITKIRFISMGSASSGGLLAGAKFEIYGVTA